MATDDAKERENAIRFVLTALRNPLMMMSKPDRERAAALATEHHITALDLLAAVMRRARDA